ncbi:MAG TPA: type IV secretion system DNA-binding domain-containing protein [Anaerolineaceae bacterium]|jgi:type IV secretory pathway TraG/TraD family ATPase VirD4|nr:type IV secretion system DNA-binding domain-containing protein [Anaerolineaceae bacterium]HPL43486.1 type IV secretion system DNA-binding domain-containing protein [Anaerolineaceae bacterium]HPY33139.1 type IV secretion system DNA-binding domain-containing protein [Anaerolineaceae bacterium]
MLSLIKLNPVFGSVLNQNPFKATQNPLVRLPGKYNDAPEYLGINGDILSKHILLIGGTGTGKTNLIFSIVSQLKASLKPNDVLIVFDTKGDYTRAFGKKEDYFLGNPNNNPCTIVTWNIFGDILADGTTPNSIDSNINEISWSIFKPSIDKSKDPFFPNAARELFGGILQCMTQNGINNPNYKTKYLNNSELKEAFSQSSIQDIIKMIERYPQISSVLNFIGDGSSDQALGVYAELLACVKKIFINRFAGKGDFSIRNFVREKGGKTLFIDYDISIGNVLSPIYSLLFDLALKESLGRSVSQGNVYLVFDEFKLLPSLQHIEDGVNFGRGLGVKVIAGIQSIHQLLEAYGESGGKNILAGFSTMFAFKTNDPDTRKYVTNHFGENMVVESFRTITNTITEERRVMHVVEDWDINSLNLGEAIVGFPFCKPFKFAFDQFKTSGL